MKMLPHSENVFESVNTIAAQSRGNTGMGEHGRDCLYLTEDGVTVVIVSQCLNSY